MKTTAYIIHLERSVNREGNLARMTSNCPMPAKIQAATDGNCLSRADINEVYIRQLYRPVYPFEMRPTEIGIFLSHRTCWKRMLAEGVDAALIMEDDIGFDDNFGAGFGLAMQHIGDLHFIQFPVRKIRRRTTASTVVEGPGSVRILEPYVVPLGACAQLVSSSAAERLVRATEKFDRPIDCFFQLRNVTELPIFSVVPSGVGEISNVLGGSTIHVKDRQIGWADRELRRIAYRMNVWRVSRRYMRSARGLIRES